MISNSVVLNYPLKLPLFKKLQRLRQKETSSKLPVSLVSGFYLISRKKKLVLSPKLIEVSPNMYIKVEQLYNT